MNKKLRMKEIVLVIGAIVIVAWAMSMAANAQVPFPNSPDNLSGGETGSGGDIMYVPNARSQNIGGGLCIRGYLTMEDGAIWLPMYQACEIKRRSPNP